MANTWHWVLRGVVLNLWIALGTDDIIITQSLLVHEHAVLFNDIFHFFEQHFIVVIMQVFHIFGQDYFEVFNSSYYDKLKFSLVLCIVFVKL